VGSVKDLLILEEAQNNKPGLGRFVFSDRYSVFDWGEMPDHIPKRVRQSVSLLLISLKNLEN